MKKRIELTKKELLIARVDRLEARLTQLECEHDLVLAENYEQVAVRGDSGNCYFKTVSTYRLECSKCEKVVQRFATEAEYLKAKLARMTDQCAADKAKIKARLKVLKEDTNG